MTVIYNSSDFKYHVTNYRCYSINGNNWRYFMKIEVNTTYCFSLHVTFEYDNDKEVWKRKHKDDMPINRFLDAVFTDDLITDLYFKTFQKFIPKMNEMKKTDLEYTDNVLVNSIREFKYDKVLQSSFEKLDIEERCNLFNKLKVIPGVVNRFVEIKEFMKLWDEN